MSTYFNEALTESVRAWLLEEDNPAVRRLALINLLDESAESDEVQHLEKRLMSEGSIAKILSHQNADGSFLNDKMIAAYGLERARSGYQPRCKATTWQALFLAQMGADPNDERIRKLAEFILNTNYNPERRVFSIYTPTGEFGFVPCFVANMIWALSEFGFHDDKRVQESIAWLLEYQRFDDGDFKTPNDWPYRGRRDRCFGSHSCHSGCAKALKAMTTLRDNERTKAVRTFEKRAIDYLLLHRLDRRSHGSGRLIRPEYDLLTFPIIYYEDIIGLTELVLFYGARHEVIDEAIHAILSRRRENGKWVLEKGVSPSSVYAKFETQGDESKWVTYRVLKLLKKYDAVNTDSQ